MEAFVTMGEHAPVIVEGEPDFDDGGVFEEVDEALREAHEVEAEEEADAIAGYLQQGYLILHATFEGWACLGVDAEEFEGA